MPARNLFLFVFLFYLSSTPVFPEGYTPGNPKGDEVSSATPVYVRWDAAGGGDGTSWETAFQTIGDALIEAVSGAEIWIAGGTYTEALTVELPLTLRGGLDPTQTKAPIPVQSATPTVVDASGLDSSVVSILSASPVELVGLTLTGGHTERGGGIYSVNSTLNLADLRILDNTATARGGGVFCSASNLSLKRSLVHRNVAVGIRSASGGSSSIFDGIGGGIRFQNGPFMEMIDTTVRENRCGAGGSGLEVDSSLGVELIIRDSTFTENVTDFIPALAGPICLDQLTSATLENVRIANNRIEGALNFSFNAGLLGRMVPGGAVARLAHCEIVENASMSGVLLNEVSLENCRVIGNPGAGVSALKVDMASSEVSGNGRKGVTSRQGGDFLDCTIAENGGTGLEVNGPNGTRTNEIRIVGCAIVGNGTVTPSQPGVAVVGGVYIEDGSVTILKSAISENLAGGLSGGGIEVRNATARVLASRIDRNRSQSGSGGVFLRNSNFSIEACEVIGNSTLQPFPLGANGMTSDDSAVDATNTLIVGNEGTGRGGVYMDGGEFSGVNCAIQGNQGGGIQGQSAGALRLLNTIVSNGTGGLLAAGFDPVDIRFCANGEILPGEGNLTGDPLFIQEWDGDTGDLRLRCDSLFIDAGTSVGAPTTDFNGRARPYGIGVDLGPYENCMRDLNGDLEEDGLDLLFFPSEWYRPVTEKNAVFDFSPSPPSPSRIDSLDLIELLKGVSIDWNN